MRQYIDIVRDFLTETAEIIPFPNRNKNPRPEFSPIGRQDRFNLVISTLTDGSQRKIFGKVADLSLESLMKYFKSYDAQPRDSMEAGFWTTSEGKTQYDFHVAMNGEKLSVQEFNSLNRMIKNNYEPMLGSGSSPKH